MEVPRLGHQHTLVLTSSWEGSLPRGGPPIVHFRKKTKHPKEVKKLARPVRWATAFIGIHSSNMRCKDVQRTVVATQRRAAIVMTMTG